MNGPLAPVVSFDMDAVQFADFGGSSKDIEDLKLRARLFAVGALRAGDVALARKLFHHSRVFARKAHALENNQRRIAE